ncbi:hypothetical protein E2C01_024024 [Portunus trituberculatus]|uniref:Uncharacterized protein n=1 Tax=Portunus trituberculatus TaxID=210409 RepID=A0A5B7ECR2_PORTR|nr:hypothetical protein [Portunus trituberculatus]
MEKNGRIRGKVKIKNVGRVSRRSRMREGFCTSYTRSRRIAKLKAISLGWLVKGEESQGWW